MYAAVIAMALAAVPLPARAATSPAGSPTASSSHGIRLIAAELRPAQLKARIESLRAVLERVTESLNDAGARLDDAEKAVARHRKALAVAAERNRKLQTSIGRRAGDLYRLGTGTELGALLTATNLSDLVDRFVYLQKVREEERGLLEDVRALRAHAGRTSRALSAALRSADASRDRLADRRAELNRKMREYRTLLRFLESAGGRLSGRASRGGQRGFVCPVIGSRIVYRDYGAPRPGGPHSGIDIAADYGQGVAAVLPGRIVATPGGGWIGRGIVLRDLAGNEWLYAHLASRNVSVGEFVSPGQRIGRIGCSGRCYGPHLHFEWHPGGGGPRNPYRLLSSAC